MANIELGVEQVQKLSLSVCSIDFSSPDQAPHDVRLMLLLNNVDSDICCPKHPSSIDITVPCLELDKPSQCLPKQSSPLLSYLRISEPLAKPVQTQLSMAQIGYTVSLAV